MTTSLKIPLKVPFNFTLTSNHLTALLEACKLNIWDYNLLTKEVIDFGYSESLATLAGFEPGRDNIDTFYLRVHPDDLAHVQERREYAYRTLTDYSAEFRIKLLSGQYEWVSSTGRYLCDNLGTPYSMIGIWRFISEDKKNEELLHNQKVVLDRLARSYFVGEITATVTHQISQPLVSINTYVSASLRRMRENNITHNELIESLEETQKQVELMNRAIKRIKSFIMHGELKYEEVDFHMIVNKSINLVKSFCHCMGTIECDIDENIPPIMLDRNQIIQVFHNLIYNGIEAIHEANTPSPKLYIKVRKSNDFLKVSIIDNGGGLSDDSMERLFTPFFSTKTHGMGIGLAICRRIIELHGGTLNLERNPSGTGAISSFSIPIHLKQV